MSEQQLSPFPRYQLAELAAEGSDTFVDGPFGSSLKSHEYVDAGVRLIQLQNIGEGEWRDQNKKFITPSKFKSLERHGAVPGDIAIAKMAEPVARACLVPAVSEQFVVVADCIRLRLDEVRFDAGYVVRAINSPYTRREAENKAIGSTRVRINLSVLKTVGCLAPSLPEQKRITCILDTLDASIQETEAILAKLKAVKQGLLHDLLTRGIDANGELRPPLAEAPNLYKESPQGWIPTEWEVAALGELAESLVDGPFGSNLKTAHYVENPGVRVVRLQNILSGEYDDSERAFISDQHAASLLRNRVTAGDALVASLGDANYPVGRSCCYPPDLPDAINKADCFRFRSGRRCRNEFVMHAMNGAGVRKQVRGYEQGVTMKRINLGNLRRVEVALPSIPEQEMIVERLRTAQQQTDATADLLRKLRSEKQGLMDDLLTGRVRVTPLLARPGQIETEGRV